MPEACSSPAGTVMMLDHNLCDNKSRKLGHWAPHIWDTEVEEPWAIRTEEKMTISTDVQSQVQILIPPLWVTVTSKCHLPEPIPYLGLSHHPICWVLLRTNNTVCRMEKPAEAPPYTDTDRPDHQWMPTVTAHTEPNQHHVFSYMTTK